MDQFVTIDGDLYNTKLIKSVKFQENKHITATGVWESSYNLTVKLTEAQGWCFELVTEAKLDAAVVRQEMVAIKTQLATPLRFITVGKTVYQTEAIVNIVKTDTTAVVHLINGQIYEHPMEDFPFDLLF